MNAPLSAHDIWRMPIILALVIAIGLLSALLGDGPWDVLSWAALAAPIAVILWHVSSSAPSQP